MNRKPQSVRTAVFCVAAVLRATNVGGGWTLWTLLDIKCYSITLLEVVKSDVNECLSVEEDILLTIIWLNKTKTIRLDAYD